MLGGFFVMIPHAPKDPVAVTEERAWLLAQALRSRRADVTLRDAALAARCQAYSKVLHLSYTERITQQIADVIGNQSSR